MVPTAQRASAVAATQRQPRARCRRRVARRRGGASQVSLARQMLWLVANEQHLRVESERQPVPQDRQHAEGGTNSSCDVQHCAKRCAAVSLSVLSQSASQPSLA